MLNLMFNRPLQVVESFTEDGDMMRLKFSALIGFENREMSVPVPKKMMEEVDIIKSIRSTAKAYFEVLRAL